MSALTIDKAGRIVIPKPLRDKLHLRPGDALEVDSDGDSITLVPARRGGQFTKENGFWVLRTGEPISAELTNRVLEELREERMAVADEGLK